MEIGSKVENKSSQNISNVLWSLFGIKKEGVFQTRGTRQEAVEDFIKNNTDVRNAAEVFVQSVENIWLKYHPNMPLERNVVEKYLPPNITDTNKNNLIKKEKEDLLLNNSTSCSNKEAVYNSKILDQKDIKNVVDSSSLHTENMTSIPTISDQNTLMKILFQVQNAKVGNDYIGKIEKVDDLSKQLYFRSIRIPPELGLTSNGDRGEVTGIPVIDGDHEITFQWSDDQLSWLSGKCILMVNPDPRSLWQVNEPPADAPYSKAHTDERLISYDSFKIVAASRRGRSHEHSGTFRDDDFFLDHNSDNGWSVIIVADGAGSATFSRQGSKLAAQTFGEHIVSNLSSEVGLKLSSILDDWDVDPTNATNNFGTEFHYLFFKAATLAVQALNDEASSTGNNVKDYSTTLLAAAIKRNKTDTYLATFWLGDGAIVAYGPRGKVRLMGTPDAGEFAGQTRFLDRSSLSDQGFAKRIGIGRYADITSVILMTDGVSDPRFETDNGLANPDKWDLLWDEITPQLESDNPGANLLKWLEFFSPGNHDDRTIAILW